MGFNRFILNIIIRVLLIVANAFLIAFLFKSEAWFFSFLFAIICLVIQTVLLILYLGKVNTDLANFLIHLREQDTTMTSKQNAIDRLFGGLSEEFRKINDEVKKVNSEKIKKQNILNQLLNQVGTGIVIINCDNKIKLYNKAFLNILGFDSYVSNKTINDKLVDIFKDFNKLVPGKQSIETIQVESITRRILIALSEIREDNNKLRVYSFHDIDREMTDYELQSWNGLIRVLAHEIMNTVTPISTVVDTIKDCFVSENKSKQLSEINEKDISDSINGVKLIDNRIKGLVGIVDKFRLFAEISLPTFQQVCIKNFLINIIDIYKMNFNHFTFDIDISKDLLLNIDKSFIELTINNIIKNAIEASGDIENPSLTIRNTTNKNQTVIEFLDNGAGIPSDVIKKVFLPFYTTKEQGSGIGLSLARQIMFSHGGDIKITSSDKGTSVKLFFNTIKQ